jgi:hypothetical protein
MTDRQNHHETQHRPRLVPTGSFDKVLLIGGKKLTLFQSVALIITGLAVALGVGVPMLVLERYWMQILGRYGYTGNSLQQIIGGLIVLWGAFMVINGSLGLVRQIGKKIL